MRGVVRVALLLPLVLGACRDKKPVRVVAPDGGESAILPRAPAAPKDPSPTSLRARTIRVGDRDREYVLVAPKELATSRLYPLVLAFHGDGGDAGSFHDAWPFERASRGDAFVAYPNGIGATWDLETKSENRDVAFVEALVRELVKTLPIDEARLFGTGYSSGGFLVNVVACQKSGLLRAIASNAGGAPYKQATTWPNGYTRCPGQAPIAMMALHGTQDFGVQLDSGRFSAAYWAYVDGCEESAMETTGYAECRAYQGCKGGKHVVWCEIPGLGHWVWDQAAAASWGFFQRQ